LKTEVFNQHKEELPNWRCWQLKHPIYEIICTIFSTLVRLFPHYSTPSQHSRLPHINAIRTLESLKAYLLILCVWGIYLSDSSFLSQSLLQ